MFGEPSNFELAEDEEKAFKEVVKTYKGYLTIANKEEWFENIKKMSDKLGYATNNAEYKANPEKFKGNVAKVCEYIRIAITGRKNSPDLFEIMSLLGEKEVLNRLSKFA